MNFGSYTKNIVNASKRSSSDFVEFYIENQQSFLTNLKKYQGLKTDLAYSVNDTHEDWVKFSVVFSDITLLNLKLGKGGIIQLASKENNFGVETVTFPYKVSDDIKKHVETGLLPGYMAPTNEELVLITDNLKPFIESEKVLIRPTRVILYPVTDKDGERGWNSYSVDPNSPVNDWLIIDSSVKQNLLPIRSGEVIPSYENEYFNISIPYLENVDSSTLVKIIDNEHDHLFSLRQAIKKSISELPNQEKRSEEISNDIIKPELEKLNRNFKKITQIHSLRIAGATVSTVALALVSLTSEGWIAAAASFLGASGISLVAKEYSDYLEAKAEVKENPFYLFWRLKKGKR